eukprot:4636676-Amphidinium_carterae.2
MQVDSGCFATVVPRSHLAAFRYTIKRTKLQAVCVRQLVARDVKRALLSVVDVTEWPLVAKCFGHLKTGRRSRNLLQSLLSASSWGWRRRRWHVSLGPRKDAVNREIKPMPEGKEREFEGPIMEVKAEPKLWRALPETGERPDVIPQGEPSGPAEYTYEDQLNWEKEVRGEKRKSDVPDHGLQKKIHVALKDKEVAGSASSGMQADEHEEWTWMDEFTYDLGAEDGDGVEPRMYCNHNDNCTPIPTKWVDVNKRDDIKSS